MESNTIFKVALENVPNSTCCLSSPHTFPSQDRALVHIWWRDQVGQEGTEQQREARA